VLFRSDTNTIISKYPQATNILTHKKTILENIRGWSWVKKLIVGTAIVGTVGGGAIGANSLLNNNSHTTTNTTTKTVEIKKEVPKKTATVEYHAAMENIKVVKQLSKQIADTIPKAPPGFKYLNTATAKVTAYNPTGPGLMARGYPERGITSTGRDAINNLDGIAIDPKLIPYGSMVYIINPESRNVWKLADDTGHLIREDGDKGITHVDIRAQSYKWAINYGKKDLIVHIFVPSNYKPSK
jgi:3D (Asp-Asp-Asp) domain-containing protein